jgi:hypothetical protein
MQPTYCVSDIHNQTNQRISDRNLPSQMLQPYLNVRPASTKYSYLPVVEPRKPAGIPLQQMPTYNGTKPSTRAMLWPRGRGLRPT